MTIFHYCFVTIDNPPVNVMTPRLYQELVAVTEQLEGALRSQLQQQQAMQGGGDPQNINPATHPQYAAEMSKMLGDLNDQYSQAIDQRKEMLGQLFQG